MNMRFKDFIWPNNPHTCSVTRQRQVVAYQYPGGGFSLEDMGQNRRVMSGAGEFYGEGAYKNMMDLLAAYEKEGAGRLFHPVIKLEQAVFSCLELTQEPRDNYVAYRFEFLEECGTGKTVTGSREAKSYVVRGGETLWDVAALYDRDVQTLMALNGWIRNPNVLAPGKQVVLQ